jgi:uncharacterized RDD family membrane protein YckC
MSSMPPDGGTPPPPPPPPPPGGGYGAPMPAVGGAWAGPPLASWGERVVAGLIDYVAPYVVAVILFQISSILGTLAWLGALGFIIYSKVQEGNTGVSIGKGVAKLRLLSEETGQPIGAGMAVLRWLLHFLDGICLIGYLFPLWDPKKQTFADKILKTVVVKA